MILNNFYSLLLLLMPTLSIPSFVVLFVLLIHKDLGGAKFARDSFLFFDYIFFSSDMGANASALSVIYVSIFGSVFNHNRNPLIKNYLADIVWFLNVVLFPIHYHFFSNLEYDGTEIIFVRELFFNLEVRLRLVLLWLLRLLFVILILGRFYHWLVVENNLLDDSEYVHVVWICQHGTDTATCIKNSSDAACQETMDERDAIGLALTIGTVALLPGSVWVMWGLGASADAGISCLADDAVDPANTVIAGWGNVFSMGGSLVGAVGWSAAGGALGNRAGNKDPLSGAISDGIGPAARYDIGKGIIQGTDKAMSAVGRWVTNDWSPKYDPTWIEYTEINRNDIIRRGMKPSNIPGATGNIGDSIGSEPDEKVTDKVSEEPKK